MKNRELYFEEMSKVTAAKGIITPEDASALGYACAAGSKGAVVSAHSGTEGAAALAYAFASGAAAAGQECILLGECTKASAAYTARELGAAAGCWADTEISAYLSLFSSDGLPLHRTEEDSLLNDYTDTPPLPYRGFGRIVEFKSADKLYCSQLKRLLTHVPENFYADVYCPLPSANLLCAAALEGKSKRHGTRIAFHINRDGSKASAYSDETGYVFHDKLMLICCNELLRQGKDCAVCGIAPVALEKLAQRYSKELISCNRAICTAERHKDCSDIRRLSAQQLFANDGAALVLTVMDILAAKGCSLKQAVNDLPDSVSISRYILTSSPSELISRLGAADSIAEYSHRGRVTLRPVRTGTGVILDAESFNYESASELCDFYERKIRHLTK